MKQREQRKHCSHTTITPELSWTEILFLNNSIYDQKITNFSAIHYILCIFCSFYYLYMLPVLQLSLYSLFIHLLFYHCNVYCTAFCYSCIMSVTFVVIHICVMFWFWPVFILSCQLTDAEAVTRVYVCVCLYVNKTKTLKQNIKFCIYIYRNEWRTKQTFSFIYIYA